jgi:hypothetical protein
MANIIKEVLMRKIWKIPIYLIIVLVGVSAATAAVMYSLRIPSTITILESEQGIYEIGIYEDQACTTEVTSFDFDSVALGGNSSVHFYVKSLSDVPIEVTVVDDPNISYVNIWLNNKGTGSITHTWFGGSLEPDEVREITLTLDVMVQAQSGTYNFDLLFEVYPAA